MTSLFPESFKERTFQLEGTTTNLFTLYHSASSPPSSPADRRLLILLHGYPQNHTLWHLLVPELSSLFETHDILIPDLPGYGRSTKAPSTDGSHYAHSKRAIAADIVALVDNLFGLETRFVVAGHDRGARVAYRLARDYPTRVVGLNVQDIVLTRNVFEQMSLAKNNHAETFTYYHWIFLALPFPLPETLISASPSFYFTHTLNSWTGSRSLGKFHPVAMNSWISQYDDPAVLLGSLEDYRAGATIDLVHDAEDDGRVECGVLALWSAGLGRRYNVGRVWRDLGGVVEGWQVGDDGTGHFLPLEAVGETASRLLAWMEGLSWK